MAQGPTQGAQETPTNRWTAHPALARAVRIVATLVPAVASWLVVRTLRDAFWHPDAAFGWVAWVAQALATGMATVVLVERFTRRLLPLAALMNLSLVFPDQAPSRYGIALRSGTVRTLRARAAELPGSDDAGAATRVLEMVAALGRHERLTRGHTERVRAYAALIGEEMGLPDDDRDRLNWACLVHDIGKLTVSPDVLNKNGRPTDEEWEQLRGHPAAGADLVEPLAGFLGEWRLAASEHHERWDGNGYPYGLAGSSISLAGRIVAVADAYDVITSARSYKKPMSVEAARAELVRCAGTQFDPDVVRAFLNVSLGRLSMVAGPLGWLREIPRFGESATQLAGTSGAALIAGVASGIAALTGSVAPAVAEGAPIEVAAPAARPMVPDAVAAARDEPAPSSSAVPASSGASGASAASGASGASGGRASGATVPSTAGRPGVTVAGAPTTTLPGPVAVVTTTTTAGRSGPATGTALAGPTPSTPPGPTAAPGTTAPATTTTTAPPTAPPTTSPPPTSPPPTTQPNRTPVAQGDAAFAVLNRTTRIEVLANDTDADGNLAPGTLTVISPPNRGTAIVDDGAIVYSPGGVLLGSTSLVYRVCDTAGACATATVSIAIFLA